MIRLVVSDVDGTMLDESEKIPDKMKVLSDEIRKKNILFTLASGREYSQVKELKNILDIRVPIILCNGTAARDSETFSWCEAIPSDVLSCITEQADKNGMTVILSTPDGEYAFKRTRFVEKTIEKYGRFGNILRLSDDSLDKVSVQKVLIIDRDNHHQHLEAYNELLQMLHNYSCRINWIDYGMSIDIVPKGCTKAEGVRRLAKELNVELGEVMALGDDYNDLEMIKEVGLGIAVNNAVEELKQGADYICEGKYLDGVIEAIKKFC